MAQTITEYEMKLVTDAEILLAKNCIIKKVQELFGNLLPAYEKSLENAPSFLSETTPKISKGENYLGLPFVMSDFPRLFGKEDVFAIRTFFWWGNFFSITLQLAGNYQLQYAGVIEKAIIKNEFEGWSICTSDNPWHHHFGDDNYTVIDPNNDYHLVELPFIKIAKKIPLEKWEYAEKYFKENFDFLINRLHA